MAIYDVFYYHGERRLADFDREVTSAYFTHLTLFKGERAEAHRKDEPGFIVFEPDRSKPAKPATSPQMYHVRAVSRTEE